MPRPCAGHPRLAFNADPRKTWMAGTSPAMTRVCGRSPQKLASLLRQLLQDQHRKIILRREIGHLHLEAGRADLLHIVSAEADQALGVALVDDEAEFLDRPRPVGAGAENIFDALLAIGRAELALRFAPRALDRGEKF